MWIFLLAFLLNYLYVNIYKLTFFNFPHFSLSHKPPHYMIFANNVCVCFECNACIFLSNRRCCKAIKTKARAQWPAQYSKWSINIEAVAIEMETLMLAAFFFWFMFIVKILQKNILTLSKKNKLFVSFKFYNEVMTFN